MDNRGIRANDVYRTLYLLCHSRTLIDGTGSTDSPLHAVALQLISKSFRNASCYDWEAQDGIANILLTAKKDV
jgi:hypothetical protein